MIAILMYLSIMDRPYTVFDVMVDLNRNKDADTDNKVSKEISI